MNDSRVDVLIVTAIQVERRAVREHLHSLDVMAIDPAVVDVGQFAARDRSLRVAILEVGPGNIDASVLTTITTNELRPAITMMVGVAGAVKDLALGDVVASSKIYWSEPGKSLEGEVLTRPGFGEVSESLVQAARRVAVDAKWQERITPRTTLPRGPAAVVAPIVVGERVVASTESDDAKRIRQNFGDAVAVAMEDVGVARASAIAGASEMIAIRSASDLLDGKAHADATGAQPAAAANAAAFAFELLASRLPVHLFPSRPEMSQDFYKDVAALYPTGPTERGIWERAGGDLAAITLGETGQSMWRTALRELDRGGGGRSITMASLIAEMRNDYPNNDYLRSLSDPTESQRD